MELNALIAECTAYDFKVMLEEKKPIFKSTPTQFQTIIFATSDTQNVGDYGGDMSETKLTDRQSVSQRTIERDLSAMQKKGVLKHEGKDNDGVWKIKKSIAVR